ncbi:DUF4127 family protein [Paenibacillus bovis]|uniref:DUF4127 domain-containing protein n=1 Tax=Paenibacillus bovis TaxID=1616788 RepID=A0A172ZB60_9BACL|nr:DUF4127 family protein [Paenibacillus bovis]ANF94733.1 hypothetical protein AR543_00915 [Paenibacillus bovis]
MNSSHGTNGKIVMMPLDERPCNYNFPYELGKSTDYKVVRPPLEWMGHKKQPADTARLWTWTELECLRAKGAVLSLDTLLYGGIVPSRLHELDQAEIARRMEQLRQLKEQNPELVVYAFQLIMRCPQYSSSDEEPDYYADWGREIFRKGYLEHLDEEHGLDPAEQEELSSINARLPQEVLDDYLGRRAVNREANRLALRYVEEGIIDFLIFPQDDSAPYGYTARDQRLVREAIREKNLGLRVYMYPGADEVGCTLLARIVNHLRNTVPAVYVRFGSVEGPHIIPAYEDRRLYETLKYQIVAAGGMIVSSQSEADLVLLLNTPGEKMGEAVHQGKPSAGYDTERNLVELVEYAGYLLDHYKHSGQAAEQHATVSNDAHSVMSTVQKRRPAVAVADIAYANGGDLELLSLLRQRGILYRLAGYAGWNTSSNTLGTVIAQSMIYTHYGMTPEHLNFLALRYVEDFGYDSVVRKNLSNGPIQELGLDKFLLDGPRGHVSRIVREALEQFIRDHLQQEGHSIRIMDCYMPWNRMFEVGLCVHAD